LKDRDRDEREAAVVVEVWSLFRLWREGLAKAEEGGREWERCCSVACLDLLAAGCDSAVMSSL
jgi:hypothetical protein